MMFKLVTHIFAIALIVNYVNCDQISYEGHRVYRCWPQTSDQVEHLRELMNNENHDGVKFWTEPSGLNRSVDILVAPKEQQDLQKKLAIWHIPNETVLSDVNEAIQRSSALPHRAKNGTRNQQEPVESDFFQNYQSYPAIEARLKLYAQNPLVSVEEIGKSYERRNLYVVKISKNRASNKPIILIDGLHHAREWISGSTTMYLIENLINLERRARVVGRFGRTYNLTKSRPARRPKQSIPSDMLDHYDIWVVPIVNPDGYEYSRNRDRLWRKTRSNMGMFCSGVDPNRNYDHHWMESGTSRQSCSETFGGPRAFSEKETQAISALMKQNKNRIKMYISLHAYSQVILCPYGYAKVYPDNYKDLESVALAAIEKIQSVRGTHYTFGTSAISMYPAAGGSDDYAHGALGIRYSYTIELPDQGRFGFLLPATEIRPVGQETMVGIATMIRAVHSRS